MEITTNTITDSKGNTFTSAIDNDKLDNNDFLKIILEGYKNQDPTKEQDASALVENQLKLSTIETNTSLATSMEELTASYANNALYSASSLIGKVVEDGSIADSGDNNTYMVTSVYNEDSNLLVNTKLITAILDKAIDTTTNKEIQYDAQGGILDDDGNVTSTYIKLENERFVLSNEQLQLVDVNGNAIKDSTTIAKYRYGGADAVYSDETTAMAVAQIKKIGYENN